MHRKACLATLLTILIFSSNIFSQIGATVDPTFAPAISKEISEFGQFTSIQSDGKIIVSGSFFVANGKIAPKIVRINPDGTTDSSFNCTACDLSINKTFVQPDGKIIVAGTVPNPSATTTVKSKIIRLNPDGSLDNSFNFQGITTNTTSSATVEDMQSDGKIYVIEYLSGFQFYSAYLYRLNPDGSKDAGFTTLSANIRGRESIDIKVLSDGRNFVFGNNSYGYLAQINNDGSKNTSFESPALTVQSNTFPPTLPAVYDIALQTDGKLTVVGLFDSINGISRTGAARLNTNQSVDTSFAPTFSFPAQYGIAMVFAVSNNKLLFITSSGNISKDIERHNYDGSNDGTFDFPQDITDYTSISIDASERLYISARIDTSSTTQRKLLRYNANGSLDTGFNPTFESSGQVSALGTQPDGKVLVGGTYNNVNGTNRAFVSRVNANGTTDAGFDTENKFTSAPNVFAVQSDGKILVGGSFSYEGVAKKLVRLNSNGSKDTGFNVDIIYAGSTSNINSVVVQTDGKILIGGNFTAVNGVARTSFARLNSDGTLDASFNTELGGAAINSIVLQSDGKIVIGGTFSGVNGFNRSNFSRLNGDGTLDTSFTAVSTALRKIILQPDGKYLALATNGIIKRYNTSGSDDAVLLLSSGSGVLDMELLSDGSIIITGSFTTINDQPKNRIARLQPNGTLDVITFVKGANEVVRRIVKQSDGKLIIGGDFTSVEDIARTGIARLSVASFARPTNFDFDGDGRADIVVYRPSNSIWYQLLGSNYQYSTFAFGISEDVLAPADYDGDGKTDIAIFRPSTGVWWYAASTQNNSFRAVQWGQSGDIPLPSDVDGDGKADYVVYRPSEAKWYRKTATGVNSTINFGAAGDKPLIGDFDGDGKSDPAIYRPSTGVWWYAASGSSGAHRAVQFGVSTDVPVPADYDGDGKTDLAVYRPSNGVWHIYNSGPQGYTSLQFGSAEDKPVAADYDGDGKADIALYRLSNGSWYILRSTAGFAGLQFGVSTDKAIPNSFVP